MTDGLPQASLIIGATAIFASLAWTAGMVKAPEPKCTDTVKIVEYLPIPALEPLVKSPPLGWPIEYRQRADDAPAITQTVAKDDDADEQPRRHYRRHRRHWR